MCTTALLFVLLVATLCFSLMSGNQMAAEGLPLTRRVRGADDYEDILAGNDFLSVFLESTLHRFRKEATTTRDEFFDEETISTEPYFNRETRETSSFFNSDAPTERQFSANSSDGVIIAMHVSSSVGSQINKFSESRAVDQNYITSDEQPAIVANSGKSELTVEEPAPITKNTNSETTVDLNKLQASLQSLPSSQHINFNPRDFPNSKENSPPPFHHSLIYHDNPTQPGRARSVSYSTIIQDIQPSHESKALDRKERNYETGTIYQNSFDTGKEANLFPLKSSTTTTTTTTETPWQLTSLKPETTSQKNWRQIPKVYGRPEQNYEIDEAVSVVTNGRTHGIQQGESSGTPKPGKEDKDQKVGYVVEGRNYRKYRVEERTPDGFIVGEYGVVSHDDGSLRGVRYTADGTINPRLIYDALMKFLAL
ncbi:uncharacterized protein [Euwallacea similis]|uniref:uncharacterized protein n=1 Tax=Euwallacea similis TaxID=1736056 RepID=UPI00344E1314